MESVTVDDAGVSNGIQFIDCVRTGTTTTSNKFSICILHADAEVHELMQSSKKCECNLHLCC